MGRRVCQQHACKDFQKGSSKASEKSVPVETSLAHRSVRERGLCAKDQFSVSWETILSSMLHVIEPHPIKFRDVVIIEGIIDLPSILAATHQFHLAQSAQLM